MCPKMIEVVRITVFGAPKMSYNKRRRLATFLRRQARELVSLGKSCYSNRFTAKFYEREGL